MAHEITQHDQMISARNITPWHGIGEIVGDFGIDDLHRIMDWEVQKLPLITTQDDATDVFATVRMPRLPQENNIVLGAGLSKSYKILQNHELIKIVEPFVQKGCALETAGTLKQGCRVWILLRLSKDIRVQGDDLIKSYIMVSNDHTGCQAARIGLVGIRVVCNNTLTIAEGASSSQLIRICHQGDISKNMEFAASMLDHANGRFINYHHDLNKISQKGINETDLRQYVRDCFFGKWNDKKMNDRKERILKTEEKIIELFETGAGADLKSARGTIYGAYQAVNHYLNHNREVPSEKRLSSLVWGNRAIIDQIAFNNAMKLAS